jgi:hypothetical protein
VTVVSAGAPPSASADHAFAGRVTSTEGPPVQAHPAPTRAIAAPGTLERSVADAGFTSVTRPATPADAGSSDSQASAAQDGPAPISRLSDSTTASDTTASDKATAWLLPAVAHSVAAGLASKLRLPALRAPVTAAILPSPAKAARGRELRTEPGVGYGRAERLRAASSKLDLDREGSYSAHPSGAGGSVPMLGAGAAVPSKRAFTGIGTGTSALALAILGLLGLFAPWRSWGLRPRHNAPVTPPVVLLLDHPG